MEKVRVATLPSVHVKQFIALLALPFRAYAQYSRLHRERQVEAVATKSCSVCGAGTVDQEPYCELHQMETTGW